MADGYGRYASRRDGFHPVGRELDLAGVSTPFRGYSPSYNSALGGRLLGRADDSLRSSSEVRHNDISLLRSSGYGYGYGDVMGIGERLRPGLEGANAGMNMGRFSSSISDPLLLDRHRDPLLGVNSVGDPPIGGNSVGPAALPGGDHASDVPSEGTDILFVEGLPSDCTRREVAHLFRPFIGFKDIKVIHKEPRQPGGKPFVICFVEFKDVKCASTALQALQGYTFDDRKPDASILRIQFARFPFRPYASHQNAR